MRAQVIVELPVQGNGKAPIQRNGIKRKGLLQGKPHQNGAQLSVSNWSARKVDFALKTRGQDSIRNESCIAIVTRRSGLS